MDRTCNLDTLIRESDERRRPAQLEDEMGEALRDAVMATRAKIDGSFNRHVKFAARLKDSRS
jgi:hypothetical protein